MHIREVYYRQHLRSLFISRFTYDNPKKIVKIDRLSIKMTTDVGSYELMSLFMYFVTKKWPEIYKCRRYKIRGKYFLKGNVTFDSKNLFYSFNLIQNLKQIYFPFLDNSVGELDHLFSIKNESWKNHHIPLKLGSVMYMFPEFDFLTQYSYSLMRQYSSSWRLVLIVSLKASTLQNKLTILRSFQLPFIKK